MAGDKHVLRDVLIVAGQELAESIRASARQILQG